MKTRKVTVLAPRPKSDPTPPPPREGAEPPDVKLSAQQTKAIEMLVAGKMITIVAQEIGVDRGTIWRWRTSDPNFIAALNRWRGQLQAETRDRVLALSADATDTVANSILGGDSRLGLRLLEKMGCLQPGPDKPVDPYLVFGAGLKDEMARVPIGRDFLTLGEVMTQDQRDRAAQILAIGIVIDDRRAGRATPELVLEKAGPVAEQAGGSNVLVHCANEGDGVGAKSESARAKGGLAPAPMRMKGRVVIDFDQG